MNLASVDLNLLVTLDAVLTERHLTRAGERVGANQPTMSQRLARLRRMFDDELLVRNGREYELTPLAEQIREPLRDILKNIELTLEQRPAFDPASDERTFAIAASDYATYLVLQPALRRIQDEAPGVRIEVHPISSAARAAVEDGDMDLAIVPASVGLDLPSEHLFTDRWVAIAWSGNHEVGAKLSLQQYRAMPHLVFGTGFQAIGIADRELRAEHPDLRVAMSIPSFFLLPFMLTGTRYIALVHERMARRLAGTTDITVLDLDFETAPVEEALYWHPRLTADPGHQWLRDLLRECAASLD